MPKIEIVTVGKPANMQPSASEFFDVMNDIEAFQAENGDQLCYEHYEALSESATVMRTLGNLFSCSGREAYAASRIRDAKTELAFYRQWITRLI
ncbi:hypothetical protein U8335_13760 [Roseiconus lacunae]|uniref:hypothetical protein n=1 Tax=Roseiconus lacunae TaxID=2605694 RepID=UPI00308B9E0F|nr:hypothetical protein U8335_13760 [Stieleria sp. HD01]